MSNQSIESVATNPTTKHCTGCRLEKRLTEFYKDRDRLTARCKVCLCARVAHGRLTKADKDRQKAENAAFLAEFKARIETVEPDGERWRPVVKYEGLYEVSDRGRVRSLWFINGKARQARPKPLILKTYLNDAGYHTLTLVSFDGRHLTKSVHSLVLTAFMGVAPPGRPCGGHRDGNPANNSLYNLRWITHAENEEDKRRHGRSLIGERNHQAKLTVAAVRQMREDYVNNPMQTFKTLAAKYGVSRVVAHKIIRRKAWKHVA
jgi:hypothetical protein